MNAPGPTPAPAPLSPGPRLDAPPAALRVLAIDDTASILGDYRRILTPADAGGDTLQSLDALEEELFGGAAEAARPAPPTPESVQLDTAPSGEAGLRLVEEAVLRGEPYGVAFVDMRMPGGWDGLKTIDRLFKADPGLQIVIATAYSDHDLDAIGREFGRNDQLLILKKPFDAVEVRQMVSALCAKRRMTEAARVRVGELAELVAARTEQIRGMALTDGLTGLPNRQALQERLDQMIRREQRLRQAPASSRGAGSDAFALLFLDFNRFKLINDSLGHEVGDELLKSISGRIRSLESRFAQPVPGGPPRDPLLAIKGPLTGYRLGGDEFVLLLEGVPCLGAAAASAVIAIEAFEAPHELGPHRCVSQASIGLASSFRDHLDAGELIRDADLAMFEAKAQGRASGRPVCVAYDGAMHAAAQRRLTLENDLRSALETDALALRYQVIRDASDATAVGVEALLTWIHPALGRVDNREIVAVAEETELIQPLGRWVRREALRATPRLAGLGHGGGTLPVHVNTSMRELLQPGFAEGVAQEVREAGCGVSGLVLEVSEVGIARQSDLVAEAIRTLHRLRLQVVLDDFGREGSSLAFLAELPLAGVKIDRLFVEDTGGSHGRLQVLQAITGFARSLGLSTAACGIETPDQLAAVQTIGIDSLQGYLMGRPTTLDALLEAEAEGFRMVPPGLPIAA